jgi:AcrR family transcriptional regulator
MHGAPAGRRRGERENGRVPTGVAIRDVREQLFGAAERILLRAGPNALTSRAVTTEAGVAKGVLHRHFTDFDAFLAELVLDRIGRIERDAVTLRDSAGTGSVVNNLVGALLDVFGSVAMSIVALVTARDELRRRLRQDRPKGVPVLAEATSMIKGYLTAEWERGRLAADADLDVLALTLIGSAHLLYAGSPVLVEEEAVRRIVTTVVGGHVSG